MNATFSDARTVHRLALIKLLAGETSRACKLIPRRVKQIFVQGLTLPNLPDRLKAKVPQIVLFSFRHLFTGYNFAIGADSKVLPTGRTSASALPASLPSFIRIRFQTGWTVLVIDFVVGKFLFERLDFGVQPLVIVGMVI
jgi:hypothetical protein